MKIQIDTLAYTNNLRWLPVRHKLMLATTLFVITYFSHPTVQILIALWMSIWIVVYARIPIKTYSRLIYVAFLFWLTSVPALAFNAVDISNLASIQADLLTGFKIGSYYIYISHKGIIQVVTILTRAASALSCLYFIMLTVPFVELLQTLRKLGFPQLLTELLLLMYRFIFVLLNTASELWTAQQARFGYRTFNSSMKSLALLIGQLFQRTIENYRQISLSVESRGFNGEFRVWYPERYKPSKRYSLEAIFGCTLLILLEIFHNA
ncbi:cobalt transport protein [Calothrix sp. NIES-4071]|nr:cobalt transport protein [Calothrix sp. NIES-4071]BAZ54655.1 cobalt transport protein [Calothrix sp. NIES-4105]